MKPFLSILIVLTVISRAVAGPSEATNPQTLSVESLVSEALAHNPELKFYEAEIAAAKGGRKAAGEWENPELSAELGGKRVEDLSGNKLGDGAAWAASVGQTFEFPGRVSLRKAIAGRQIALAELGLEQFRAALANRIRSLAYKVFVAQEKASAAREVSQRFQELLSVLVQRDPTGPAPLIETRIIEANAIALNRQRTEAARELQSALFELNQLRGAPVRSHLTIVRSDVTLNAVPALDALLASARERNFDLRTRTAELEQQGFKVKLAENERWPSVTLAPYTRGQKADTRESEVGLGVRVPLPLWNHNTGNIATAKARQLQAEVSVNVALRTVEREVAAAAAAYQSMLEEMSNWRPDALKQLREAAELADRHYRLGALPISTYTEAQKQYLEALGALLETQADALEQRQQLELLTGLRFGAAVTTKKETSK